MTTTVPTLITDKNGKQNTVHKNPVTEAIAKRIVELSEAPKVNRTGLANPLVPAPIGAIGIVKEAEGYVIWTTKDPSLREYRGGCEVLYEFDTDDIKEVREWIDDKLSFAVEAINDRRITPEENRTLAAEISTLTEIKSQLESPEEVARLTKYAKVCEKVWSKTDKLKLRGDWDLTAANINAIQRYGEYVLENEPELSGYDRDVMLAELLSIHQPYIVDVEHDSDDFPDYVHDIGIMYVAIRDEFKKAGL